MILPFTVEQFLGVFERYNEAVWPAQLLLYAVAALILVAVSAGRRGSDRFAAGALAFLWAWAGLVYHWLYFSAINPAAWLFGALFVGQAILIARDGVLRRRLVFSVDGGAASFVGLALVAYALVVYPVLGAALGHRYPAAPTFGAPCPTTIFTLGLLLLARMPLPRIVFAVPLFWAVVSSGAAFALGIHEDLGLVAAAALATWVLFRRTGQGALSAASSEAETGEGGHRHSTKTSRGAPLSILQPSGQPL